MASKTGSDSNVVLAKGTTFGTAVEGGAGSKIRSKVSRSRNATALIDDTIGSGDDMLSDSAAGAISPTLSLDKTARYDDAAVMAEAVFFGGNSVTSMADDAYTHSIIYNSTRNNNFITAAMDGCAASVIEYASCTPTKLTVNVGNPPNYVRHQIELLANNEVLASTTNTNATMEAATLADSTAIVVEPTDRFRVNLQSGGALANGDTRPFTEMVITYDVPANHISEVRGAAGNSEPVLAGDPPFACTIQVTFKELEDFTWLEGQDNGTEYKADLVITGGDIGGGTNQYECKRYFPRLKIIEAPDYNLQNSSTNPLTVTFTALTASSSPTGMIDTLPYVLYTNTQSTAYIE